MNKKAKNFNFTMLIIMTFVIIVFLILFIGSAKKIREYNQAKYDEAMSLIDSGNYDEASKILLSIITWGNVADILPEVQVLAADQRVYAALEEENYTYILDHIESVQDENNKVELQQEAHYQLGLQEYSKFNYGLATNHFIQCKNYKDADRYYIKIINLIKPELLELLYTEGNKYLDSGNIEEAKECFSIISKYNYKDSKSILDDINT